MRAEDIPLRACGGNVLLRRVRQDGSLILIQGIDDRLLQVGEVVGLGGRWPQYRPWSPPRVTPRRGYLDPEMNGGKHELEDFKAPDFSLEPPRVKHGVFSEAAAAQLDDLKVGDLVVFVNSRAYDHFRWGNDDILVYPGNWIYGVVTGTHVAENPEVRRFALEPL